MKMTLDLYKHPGWFDKVFGVPEQHIRKRDFQGDRLVLTDRTFSIGHFRAPSFKTVRDVFKARPTRPGRPTLTVRVGVDSLELVALPKADRAFIQVASQFNALESPGPYVTDVARYLWDRTQGPRASMPTAAAALWRKLHQPAFNALETTALGKDVTFGYLELTAENCRPFADGDKKAIDDLDLMLVPCTLSLTPDVISQTQPHYQIAQFYTSSAPATATDVPGADAVVYELLKRQYFAIAYLAALIGRTESLAITVHLTMVGCGVFNQAHGIVERVIREMLEEVAHCDIHFVLHVFHEHEATPGIRALGQT